MGVSGTGKSAVARRLAERLGYAFVEGDDHHPAANVARMASGVPLTDDDRRPWLEDLAAVLADRAGHGRPTVLTCSALRRSYRDLLRGSLPPGTVLFLQLDAPAAVLADRMRRREHFMPASLLASQVATLEPLQPDETGAVVHVDAPLAAVVDDAERRVRALLGQDDG